MIKTTKHKCTYVIPDAHEMIILQEEGFAASNTLPDMDPEILYDEDF